MIGRDIILAAIPHTHRNRFLPWYEQADLIAIHDRKEHREAERKVLGRG